MKNLTTALLATAFLAHGSLAEAQSLKGSRASMERQHQEAIKHGYSFVETSQVVSGFVSSGDLVRAENNSHFILHNVSYPYARPVVVTFLERLSAQYYAACGEKLTVTSLTRPVDRQPANAATNSVHPTGMAIDLRIPAKSSCRSWLESVLLSLEAADVLDVTRERNPPHYHVAVFPTTYQQYLASLTPGSSQEYVVRRGDTLSKIASRTGTSVAQLRAANGLRGDLIQIGQKLYFQTPAAVAAMAVESAAAGEEVVAVTEVTHKVKRGETLWRIARLYGSTVDMLRLENGIVDELLQVGQTLRVKVNQR
jgi:LysM repeat protein